MHALYGLRSCLPFALVAATIAAAACGGAPAAPAVPSAPTGSDHPMAPLAPVECPKDAKIDTTAEPAKVDGYKAEVIAWHCKKEQDCQGATVVLGDAR